MSKELSNLEEINLFKHGTTVERNSIVSKYNKTVEGAIHEIINGTSAEYTDDLKQEGLLAMMQAVDSWKPDGGSSLNSWIATQVKWRLRNYVRCSSTITGAARTKYGQLVYNGHKTSLPPEEEELLRAHINKPTWSLDFPAQKGSLSQLPLVETLPANTDPPEFILDAYEQADAVKELFEGFRAETKLTEKEKYVLDKKLLSDEPQTFTEIGEHFGVSKQRVYQVEKKLMKKLTDYMVDKEVYIKDALFGDE